jgi:hypothetical protein
MTEALANTVLTQKFVKKKEYNNGKVTFITIFSNTKFLTESGYDMKLY